jgi:hypothetical protein
MLSLPGEIWAVVSEMLAGERDLSAINQLNSSCREIYDATLPVLYERVDFKGIKKMEHALAFGDMDRWTHVR